MTFSQLLEPVINRLATKLAQKVNEQLDAAVAAALDQIEDRTEAILARMERRLVAAMEAGPSLPELSQRLQLDAAAKAAGMVPVSAAVAEAKGVARDAAAVAAEEIRAMLARRRAEAAQPRWRPVQKIGDPGPLQHRMLGG